MYVANGVNGDLTYMNTYDNFAQRDGENVGKTTEVRPGTPSPPTNWARNTCPSSGCGAAQIEVDPESGINCIMCWMNGRLVLALCPGLEHPRLGTRWNPQAHPPHRPGASEQDQADVHRLAPGGRRYRRTLTRTSPSPKRKSHDHRRRERGSSIGRRIDLHAEPLSPGHSAALQAIGCPGSGQQFSVAQRSERRVRGPGLQPLLQPAGMEAGCPHLERQGHGPRMRTVGLWSNHAL